MAYDEGLAQRVREIFQETPGVEEKRMFGGLAFMVRGHMCVGVLKDVLMARVGAESYAEALRRPAAREMSFTGKSLKGFVFVDPPGIAEDEDLRSWVEASGLFVASLPAK